MIHVSPCKPADSEQLAQLMQEMDSFYGEQTRESIEEKSRSINETLFCETPHAFVLAAFDHSNIVGLASYSFLWPAELTAKSLYLKELYVRASHRRQGVGNLLMSSIFEVAAEDHCARVEWTTDRDNQAAQEFYSRMEFEPLLSKLFYRSEVNRSTKT